jgi:hypothetical protein
MLGGTLIALSERGLDRLGNLRAFLLGGPSPGEFTVKRAGTFDITDAALLPSGDLLILERSFSWSKGLFIQIRRIAIQEVKPGAIVDGPILLEADLAYEIDNLEGLSVHRANDGAAVLTLISDDNFSMLQRVAAVCAGRRLNPSRRNAGVNRPCPATRSQGCGSR